MIVHAGFPGGVMAEESIDDEQEWGVARVVESNEEAILAAGFLNSNGIPAQVESLHTEELPVNVGGLGEVRVRVPAARLAEAQALLDQSDLPGESLAPGGLPSSGDLADGSAETLAETEARLEKSGEDLPAVEARGDDGPKAEGEPD
jgi:hypothetical protein